MDCRRTVSLVMIAALLLGTLSGCARYYWSKPNGTGEQFDKDSLACAREAAPTPTAAAHGIVIDQLYRACMTARGWVREKQFDPPPPGSFRGIE